MHDRDIGRGQVRIRVVSFDSRIIPLRDFAEKDVRHDVRRKTQRLRDPLKVVGNHHRAEHRRHVQQFCRGSLQFGVSHRRIRSAKVNCACLNLLDAATGSDRLIIDLTFACALPYSLIHFW